jgi:hypothetical protein
MSEQARSEEACPVCSQHTLALDRPPEIDVMGVQQYSDMLGMGDLHVEGSIGIVCLTCGTHWRDKGAFDRGDADPVEDEPGAGGGTDDGPGDAADGEGGGGGGE